MNIRVEISKGIFKEFNNCREFICYWSKFYNYPKHKIYKTNIVKDLTAGVLSKNVDENAIRELFGWKHSRLNSAQKCEIERKITWLKCCDEVQSCKSSDEIIKKAEKKYLCREKGGAIFNIFFLHCLAPEKWPIFDQHTYRAMMYIETNDLYRDLRYDEKITAYQVYKYKYVDFFNNKFKECERHDVDKALKLRHADKALFAFGDFLKTYKPELTRKEIDVDTQI